MKKEKWTDPIIWAKGGTFMKKEENSTKVINGVTVTICSYENHPDKFSDARIPGYYQQPWPDGCINCQFRHHGRKLDGFNLNCGLTQNDRGHFSEVSPLGKCKEYEKGNSLFP